MCGRVEEWRNDCLYCWCYIVCSAVFVLMQTMVLSKNEERMMVIPLHYYGS